MALQVPRLEHYSGHHQEVSGRVGVVTRQVGGCGYRVGGGVDGCGCSA